MASACAQRCAGEGSLYQYAGGTRGPAITGPSTAVQDPGNRVIFAPATNPSGSPYATFLLTWELAGPAVHLSPGRFAYLDVSAGSFPRRFYRVTTACSAPAP